MKIKTLAKAQSLIGRRVRYMRRGGNRFGWEGVIDYANTQKATVIWNTPGDDHLIQEYQTAKFYCEDGEWDDGQTYIMILNDTSESLHGASTPEEDEEFERINRCSFTELAKDYESVTCESARPFHPIVDFGRRMERLGKLMQEPSTKVNELVWEARKAGFKLCFKIQPEVE